MAVITTNVYGTKTALGGSELNSLASVTFAALSTALQTNGAVDVVIEVAVTPGSTTPAGNQQVIIYGQVSLDGTNYTTGPTSGTTTTDQPLLYPLAVIPTKTASVLERTSFSLLNSLGYVPPYLKIVAFNDSTVALASSGHTVSYSLVTNSSA